MLGCLAAAIVSFGSADCSSDHSMFDWPEPSHTSPIRTSSSSRVLLPLIVIVWPLALAANFGRATFQLPFSSALAVALLPPNDTVTDSSLSAQPQTVTGLSRWTTMWLA